jgi:radical SAM protein with 4Fe4S-binding SPASM domain
MSLRLFEALVDEVGPYVYFLNLYNWGEPLLHPQIFDMIEYASNAGTSVRVSTNLNLLKESDIPRLISSGLEELLVDFDGSTQEVYEQYRVGGDLNVVVDNIRRIVAQKQKMGSPFPLVRARALVTRINETQIPEIARLAESIGVDRFETSPIYVNVDRSNDVDKWLPETASRRLSCTMRPETPKKCDQLWLNLTISWDGGVFPCCWFHQQSYDFGNFVEDQNLSYIWNNEHFVKTRSYLAGKTSIPPSTICAKCKGYPEYEYVY